jgi:hypothetical protein
VLVANFVAGQRTNCRSFCSAGRLPILHVGGGCQPTHDYDGNDECTHERVS